jgi:4'-phosphopantetheinyl transferase
MSMAESTGWTESSVGPVPDQGEIQVWRISLTGKFDAEIRLNEFLSAAEHLRASHFHFAPDRRRFIIRRAVLRQLLAAILKTEPQAIRLEFGTHGKPFVAGQAGADGLRFSCSHSADWALIALTRGSELGVDLEQRRPVVDTEDLARNFFSPVEINELVGLSPELRLAGFFDCWTRKEAFVKAIGLGLSYPLNGFSVSLSPNQPATLLEVADDIEASKKWRLISLDVAPDYSAALVFEKRQTFLKYFTWNWERSS